MRERGVFLFVGGVLIGIVIGVFILSNAIIAIAGTFPVFVNVVVAVLAFFGGIFVSRKTEKQEQIRFSGRVFEFPQAPVVVEIALRRLGSMVPTR